MTDLEYLEKYYKGNIEEAKRRLESGEPIQYIVGNTNFYGNTIYVNPHVLIPRFETEELIEKTVQRIKRQFDQKIDILDLCTGSGCIAITLDKQLDAHIDASDISKEALDVAIHNNEINQTHVHFIQSDIFEHIEKKYDVIISNPPYISVSDEIMDIVKNYEPHLALYAKHDGLYFYEEIFKSCSSYLKDNFLLAFEIGDQQGQALTKMATFHFPNCQIEIEKDLQGRDRFLFITCNCKHAG